MASIIYYIEMKTMKYAWSGSEEDYKGIDDKLGVKKATTGQKGLVYGADVKPPRIRLNCYDATKKKKSSYVRFCDPDNIESLIVEESLTGEKYKGATITSVRVASGGA